LDHKQRPLPTAIDFTTYLLRDALREDYRLIGGGQSLSKKDAELRIKGGGFQSITGATPK
ncbi:MAG: hypothetical protein WCO77_13060, partial [bacterium]